jgi:hypothetical protein
MRAGLDPFSFLVVSLAKRYFVVQGAGFQPVLSGSFLKSVVLINGRLK